MLNNLYKLFGAVMLLYYIKLVQKLKREVDMMNNLSHPPFDEISEDQLERFKSRIKKFTIYHHLQKKKKTKFINLQMNEIYSIKIKK